MSSSKTKTLLVFKYLNEFSDENNPVSTTELIEYLKNDGISCERKSIYADVKTLNDIGFNIISTMSPKRGFFMASRRFELAEVRLLVDAVSSVGFITPKKTETLINKLEGLVSKNQAEELISQVYVSSNRKCDNEEIYYVIDSLHRAIRNKVKVKFVYKRRTIDKPNRKAYTEKTFIVSPYALVWNSDHYYLICNNEKYDNLMNLRLDRMRKLQHLEEEARDFREVSHYEEYFDVADYSSKMFNMFSGEDDSVTLLCDLDIREEIMDRFGASIPLTAVDTDHFKTTINAALSDGLVSWIMNFGNKIKVLEPESLAQKVKQRADEISAIY
ncbi:MAG: WYL domain-containing transcriptional regulator [Eubacterium sp.]|nr:WYL domain-containing transcriptional regulator [Eubacterium sp.]